jgi:hypothetical protein
MVTRRSVLVGGLGSAALATCSFAQAPAKKPSVSSSATSSPHSSEIRYRYQHPRLFQQPSQIQGIPSPERATPTADYVCSMTGWAWDRKGGDWIDADGVRYGRKPFGRGQLNQGQNPLHRIDMKSALEAAKGRWCAFLLKTTSPQPRVIAGFASETPPKIDVSYADGTSEVLDCWLCAFSTYAVVGQAFASKSELPVFLEFSHPQNKPIASATLRVVVTGYYGGNTDAEIYLLDPPINKDPVEQGVAATVGSLDQGIEAKVIGAQRYVDGSKIEDFVSLHLPRAMYDFSAEAPFDPHIWDQSKPSDRKKLPHADLGKWIGGGRLQLVDSRYTGDGFKPLAPGLGALRIAMRAEAPGPGGTFPESPRGTTGISAMLFLPEKYFGRIRKLHVRYYVFIPPYSMHGKLYEITQGDRQKYWVTPAGKMLITAHHATAYGDVSDSAGGNRGWAQRYLFSDPVTEGTGGPNEGGVAFGLHPDLGPNNPVNYIAQDRARDVMFGQRGGLGGILYHGRWYCVEEMVDLNTVMMEAPGYKLDGAIKVWIDGRLALQRSGMVMRQLPLLNVAYKPSYRRPCRELGHIGLWWNWYNGGMVPNNIAKVMFVTGLAYGPEYIGPMKLG